MSTTPDDLLAWWFGAWDDAAPLGEASAEMRRWWSGDAEVDSEVRERYGTLHAEIAAGGHREWERDARGLLARIIVLDQFSRALHRGSSLAFAHDSDARRMASAALEQAWDRDLSRIERTFLYLPLMHAEDRAAHRRALMLYTGVAEEAEELGLARADYYRRTVAEASKHKAVIDRFGRYPHRNFQLERTCTPEELEYINEDGSLFGGGDPTS